MKTVKCALAMALSIGISSTTFGSEASTSPLASSSLVSWTQSALYNIYQGMIDSLTGLINIPSSIMSTVSAWTDQQKVFVATAIIASLLTVYKKEVIKRWTQDVIERLITTEETRNLMKSLNIKQIPYEEDSEVMEKRIKEALKS